MLSDEMLQLLTAFVDGEISDRDRDAVLRLLNKSSEAREVLRQLQENAHKVKQLPKHKVEPSLVDDIVQAIAESKSQPRPSGVRRRRSQWLPYVAAVMAASLLVAVVGILGWKALQEADKKDGPAFVQDPTKDKKPEFKPDPTPTPKKSNPLLADLAKMTEAMVRDFGAPIVDDKPFSASFAELRKDGKATPEFVRELNREKSVHLEVTVKKNSEAITRLASVLKYQDVKLINDAAAKKTVDDKKTEYFIYAENLTPEEVTKLVNELGDMYVMGVGKNEKKMPTPFNRVTVTPLAKDEKEKVAKLMGVEAKALEPKTQQPEMKRERQVVLLPAGAGGTPTPEVRRFVSERRATQPGTVQVVIRIRQE